MKNWFNKNKRLVGLLSALVMVVTLGLVLPDAKQEEKIDITLEKVEFNPFKTEYAQTKAEVMKKPYMLVEFFTLSCPYCIASIPAFNKLNTRDDLSVVSYIMATSKDIRTYAKNNHVKHTISRATPNYMNIFEPVSVPVSFILDTKTLEVKKKFLGKISEQKVIDFLEDL